MSKRNPPFLSWVSHFSLSTKQNFLMSLLFSVWRVKHVRLCRASPRGGGARRVSLARELWKLALAAASFARMKHPHLWWLFVTEIPPHPHPHPQQQQPLSEVMLCSVEISPLSQSVTESPFWFPGIKRRRPFTACTQARLSVEVVMI